MYHVEIEKKKLLLISELLQQNNSGSSAFTFSPAKEILTLVLADMFGLGWTLLGVIYIVRFNRILHAAARSMMQKGRSRSYL